MIPLRLPHPAPSTTKKRANKYGAKKVREGDGTIVDSRKEFRRKNELRMLERAGAIKNLRFQVEFLLIPAQVRADGKKERPCSYIADAVYERVSGELVVEDTKSEITRKKPDYVIKRKLMLQIHGVSVLEH